MNFKTWQVTKKVKDSDLLFLKALKEPQQLDVFAKLADEAALLQPSFSEGLSFLELASELILMGHLESLFENNHDFKKWQQHLHRLRYPESSHREEAIKNKYERLPWPHGAKFKFERRGDKFGVELKLFISNSSDLTKILASLERVQQELD